jgi:2,3,4,5-tetrahydropyridine-2-carboxylate N-succinyltransferase
MKLTTIKDFMGAVADIQRGTGYRSPILFAVGKRVTTGNGTVASVRFPVVNGPNQNTGTAAILANVLGLKFEGVQTMVIGATELQKALEYFAPFEGDGQSHPNVDALKAALDSSEDDDGKIVATFIFDDIAPVGVDDATLKLYGLSNRFFRPNQLNLTKIFAILPNVAWVGDVPMDAQQVERELMFAAFHGRTFAPQAIDKFPLYAHRINAAKMGVRICDAHAVRLGAYLGEGTTLMPGAYVNFNAGVEGPAMVEGLVASSVMVGAGSDIGNGARTIGVLSGGNNVSISIGRNGLLELNAVLGIPVGDAVIVSAGVAVMGGSKVTVRVKDHPRFGETVEARELAGINAVTFRRHDSTGVLEVVRVLRNEEAARKLDDGETILNLDLHMNT